MCIRDSLGRDAAGNQEPGRAGNPGFFRVKIIFKSYIKRALDEKSPVLLLSFWKFILYIADCCDIVHVDIIKLCQFNQCFNGNTDFSIFVIGICGPVSYTHLSCSAKSFKYHACYTRKVG